MILADHVGAVILAGGKGTRFWPLSRRARPKQVLALAGSETLLSRTLSRVAPLAPARRTVVVTGPDMVDAVRPECRETTVLVEPSGRNTLPAIAWGALEAAQRGARVVIVLPSDHFVRDENALRASLSAAVRLAEQGSLVTLGIRPTRAETAFGWIEPLPDGRVARFVEKPPQAVADQLLLDGKYLWNAGMFVFRVDAFRAALARHCPATADALDAIEAGLPVQAAWGRMDATSIDYAVMERHDDVRVIGVECGWSDIGSWTALDEVLEAQPFGAGIASEVVAVDATHNLVHTEGKLVALLGVHGLIVVDTPDAILIARREDAQRLREVHTALEARGLSRYT